MIVKNIPFNGGVAYVVVDSFAISLDNTTIMLSSPGEDPQEVDIPGHYTLFTDNMEVIDKITLHKKEE